VTARSHRRGWPVEHDGHRWVYSDTGFLAVDDRSCVRCDGPPTAEGHDACLGRLPGVTSACCGHGVSPPILVPFGEKEEVRE